MKSIQYINHQCIDRERTDCVHAKSFSSVFGLDENASVARFTELRKHQRTFRGSECCIYLVFARDSIYAVSAHMLSQFRPSVCPSVCHTGDSCKNG